MNTAHLPKKRGPKPHISSVRHTTLDTADGNSIWEISLPKASHLRFPLEILDSSWGSAFSSLSSVRFQLPPQNLVRTDEDVSNLASRIELATHSVLMFWAACHWVIALGPKSQEFSNRAYSLPLDKRSREATEANGRFFHALFHLCEVIDTRLEKHNRSYIPTTLWSLCLHEWIRGQVNQIVQKPPSKRSHKTLSIQSAYQISKHLKRLDSVESASLDELVDERYFPSFYLVFANAKALLPNDSELKNGAWAALLRSWEALCAHIKTAPPAPFIGVDGTIKLSTGGRGATGHTTQCCIAGEGGIRRFLTNIYELQN